MESQQIRQYVDKLISKRHHGLRHILAVVGSKQGAFWMNSVMINKVDINTIMRRELGDVELQAR